MQYRRLGYSGLKVSEICLGTWLTYGEGLNDRDAQASTDTAFEAGINFFDTANIYAEGRSETALGHTLRGYARESYVLASKVQGRTGRGPNDGGLSRKHIMAQCEASLRRLGVDYLDLYQCHSFDPDTPLHETLRALDDLITQGKVRYVGFSNWSAVQIAEALGLQQALHCDPFISCQPRYSMLRREVEREILPLCGRSGVGLIVYSPLAQGILTGKYALGQPPPEGSRARHPHSDDFMPDRTESLLRRVEVLHTIADQEGLSRAQLALAWCLRRPEVASVIIGASHPGQIQENAQAAGKSLSTQALEAIEALFPPCE